MAVYQGARLPSDTVPAAEITARPVRAAGRASTSPAPRVRPMGLLMAAIVAGTVLGMVYLTQTLGTNAASTEVYRLEAARNELITEIRRHQVVALELTQAEQIVPRAQRQKLKRLGEPIILPAP